MQKVVEARAEHESRDNGVRTRNGTEKEGGERRVRRGDGRGESAALQNAPDHETQQAQDVRDA